MDSIIEKNQLLRYSIFIMLNLILMTLAWSLIARSASTASYYERVYAKKIALLIDEAPQNTEIFLDMQKGAEIAAKSAFTPEISIENNKVKVKLHDGPGSYDNFFKQGEVQVKYLSKNQQVYLIIK
jgi:electron transfer flavoprotein alpha subunit